MLEKINHYMKEFDRRSVDGLMQLATDMSTDENKLHCTKCKAKLGFFRMLVIAHSKKLGDEYFIRCRKCKFWNRRVKGDWDE